MKKRIVIVILIVFILVAVIWLCGYYHVKNTDNLPSLFLFEEMEEEKIQQLLKGYRKIQLHAVWNDPAFATRYQDFWKLNDSRVLEVSYNSEDIVIECTVSS